MDCRGVGTIKKYRNSQNEWTSLLIRQYNKDFFVNVYFKEGEIIPSQNHKIHFKAKGRFFKDKKTMITRFSLSETEVLEDLGIDEIEMLNEEKEEVMSMVKEETFSSNSTEDDDLPWG